MSPNISEKTVLSLQMKGKHSYYYTGDENKASASESITGYVDPPVVDLTPNEPGLIHL